MSIQQVGDLQTELFEACGDLSKVKSLISRGGDPHAKCFGFRGTLLHVACRYVDSQCHFKTFIDLVIIYQVITPVLLHITIYQVINPVLFQILFELETLYNINNEHLHDIVDHGLKGKAAWR